MFTIEKTVPIPTGGRPHVYPWDRMDVGDSILVDPKRALSAAASAYAQNSRNGRKFTVRNNDDGTARIWRVS